MNRRHFFNSAVAGSAMAVLHLNGEGAIPGNAESGPAAGMPMADVLDFSSVPLFCAHEHWGSIHPIGMTEEGFRADTEAGAEPKGPVSVWDIVLDPYFGGWLAAAGHDPGAKAQQAGFSSFLEWWQKAPESAFDALIPALRSQCLTGAFQCIRQGIQALHGADLATLRIEDWQQADISIQRTYTDIFGWYREAMSRLHISALVRPVHPEFFVRRNTRAEEEAAFTRPILRIDPLLELWPETCPRRDALADMTGVYPKDASSWRACITALFDKAAQQGNVGIKQLQAYSRSLDFAVRTDRDVVFIGDLDKEQRIIFQDWVVHECCKEAHERRWPHQVHAGTHNLDQSSPLPLEALAQRYPAMKLVLLHCWPFIEESGHLAKHHANVYLDPCWQNVLNPAFLRESLDKWLGYLPASKIMCSQDSTSIEMAAGSARLTRQCLGRALSRIQDQHHLPETHIRALAADIIHNNAVAVYGIGQPVTV